MKTFGKILAGFLLFIVVLVIGLNLYFTDERLKNTILPYLNNAVGRPVEVESMSLSFFSTFPHPGIEMNEMRVPGESESDTLLSLNRMVAGVELLPLLSNRINVTELVFNNPRFTYKVYADSTNLDFFFESQETDTTQVDYDINIPYFEISNGHFGYRDFTSGTTVIMDDFDGDLSLNYADSIASSIDVEIGGFSATMDSINYVEAIPLSLTQESTFFPEREVINLRKGTFAIRGLEMDLSGSLSNWSQEFMVDLQFNSSSDNFGELLRLAPETYAGYTEGLETRGSLDLGGTIQGPVTSETNPNFDIRINVEDGYMKDPDLPQPIEDIQLAANATNKLITIDTLNAIAGVNSVNGSGTLTEPLEDSGTFDLDFIADVDLSTVDQFYDITQISVQQMAGQLDVNANAQGELQQPENATFNGRAILADGMLQYQDVPKPITNININASGTQELLTIQSLSLQAAQNSLTANGQIQNLLNENTRRINNMNTSLQFNLATIKDFYPLDEDTLRLEGQLNAQAILNGKADQIERAVQSGNITLKNGLIDYHKWDAPIRNITFESVLDGPRMTIINASFRSGDNNLQGSGLINNYLSENRQVNLKTQGNIELSELSNYYQLEPDITELSGDANFNLNVKGPLNDPAALALSGKMDVKNVTMNGEALREPVQNLNGSFNLTPQVATLNSMQFKLGSSDLNINGSLTDYMQYLKEEQNRTTIPQLTGQFSGNYLNLDELIDWSDTTSTFNLELPDLNSTLSANIQRMTITGVTMRNLQAEATTTPDRINLTKARVELFEGEASGIMRWQIPADGPSTFNFEGSLDSLRLESFFREYPILGEDSEFYRFITGTFSSRVEYTTQISESLDPLLPTTIINGNFGMSKAQINDHPIQQRLASFTKLKALRNVALDRWESTVSVNDQILTIKDLSLTSDDIGLELNGTQHLVTDKIDFSISLLLPNRFKNAIASVITSQAADALTQDNGTIMVPLRVTGTYSSPTVQPDQNVIKPLIRQTLQDKAKNTIRDLLGRGRQDTTAQADTARTDSTLNRLP